MHELYRVSRRPYLIAARPPDLAFNFLRTDYGPSAGFPAPRNTLQLRRRRCSGVSARRFSQRRDGRVAEGARLESVYTRKGIQGSNPCLSAITLVSSISYKRLTEFALR